MLSGGGDLWGIGCEENHFDGQILSPPYLFDHEGNRTERPVITSATSESLNLGDTLTVSTDVEATFSLERFGSTTHTVNTDQRRVPLEASGGPDSYEMTLPDESGVLIPGYCMLFAMNEAGVPSAATTILLQV